MPKLKLKVFITALGDNPTLSAGAELLRNYSISNFELGKSIDDVDIVLYLESGYIGLAELPRLLARVRSAPSAMHFLFSESDWPFPVLPGAYPSLGKRHPWAQSWSFLLKSDAERDDVAAATSSAEPDFLFSFLGRTSTHPVRKRVLLLDKPNTPCLDVEDGPKRFSSFNYSNTYAHLIRRSKFALCPQRIRNLQHQIFETMCLGRVPVIISDHWQPPPGVPWNEFCVVIPEKDVSHAPVLLGRLESKASMMGQLAQQTFNEYFAPSVFFDRLLTTLVANYSSCGFTPDAIYRRALRSLGLREIRTLCHQARSTALDHLFARE